jgi:hypothetical protein
MSIVARARMALESAMLVLARLLTRDPPVRRAHQPVPTLVGQSKLVADVPASPLDVVGRMADVLLELYKRTPVQRERMGAIHIVRLQQSACELASWRR